MVTVEEMELSPARVVTELGWRLFGDPDPGQAITVTVSFAPFVQLDPLAQVEVVVGNQIDDPLTKLEAPFL